MKNFVRTIKYIVKKDKSLFLLSLINTILSSFSPFISMYSIKFVLDIAEANYSLNKSILYISIIVIISFFILAIQRIIFLLCSSKFLKIKVFFHEDLSAKMMSIKYSDLDDPLIQDKYYKATKAIETQQYGFEAYINNIFSIINKIITFLGIILIVLNFDLLIVLYLVLSTIILFVLNFLISKKNNQLWEKSISINRRKDYYHNISMDFNYGKEMEFYNYGKCFLSKIKDYSFQIIKNKNQIGKSSCFYEIIIYLIHLIRDVLVYLFLITMLFNNSISIGDFSLMLNASITFSVWLISCVECVISINNQKTYIDAYFAFLDLEDSNDSDQKITIDSIDLIEFKNVCFKYPSNENMILENINISFIRGKKYGLVGLNGCGKTTIIKLLLKLYKPSSGDILINGINLENISSKSLYASLSSVFQEINLFNIPIKNNISLNDSPNENRIFECLKKVGLYEKIIALPNSIDTEYSKFFDENGIELSGGEIQKILIARALYKNNISLTIFDEPTASLDPIAENEIYELLNNLICSDTISIVISHRMASMKSCDYIYMIDKGIIKEQGVFNELMAQKGIFYDLYETQKKYYLERSTIDE